MERQRALHAWVGADSSTLRQVFDVGSVTASHHPRLRDYPQGIALLTAMDIYFSAVHAGLLVDEQIAQLLDMLSGELPRDRLALLSRS